VLSILMPVYNERATVKEAIERVVATELPVERELIVVDDGSTDGTHEILTQTDWPATVSVHRHPHNRGKGAALHTALGAARGTWSTVIDADLEYDANDIRELLPRLISGEAEAVYGSRGFTSHAAYGFWYVLGNKGVTLAANVLFNSWVSDIMTCHKAMQTDLFRSLDLREQRFGVEGEITGRLLRRGVRILEVPVSYGARSREAGKKLTATDGLITLRTLVRCRISAR
jgi:glycosyltransferase involved in cell wall biosynthesis